MSETISGFKKYEKVHRFDHVDEVDGILNGECHIFEKLDGANASVWCEDKFWICGASRNHEVFRFKAQDPDLVVVHDEFRGFSNYIMNHNEIICFLLAYPFFRLCGEWLVKHTIVYPREHLNKFYVFDVENRDTERILPYLQYRELISEYEIPFLKPMDVLINPTIESLTGYLGKTDYEGTPQGEGIVVKNYNFINKFGRQVYAKMVTKEFREMNAKVFGGPIPKEAIEMKIAATYCTLERVVKIKNKIRAATGQEPTIKDLGRLLSTIYNDIITEEMWTILKKFKNPVIDFRKLQREITDLAKNHYLGLLQGRSCHEGDPQADL